MQTNNTTPVATIYIVITYEVFGTIQTTVAFYSKEDAEKCVVDWANTNAYPGAAFTSADEAIDWFVDSDENVEVSIRLEETFVYGDKAYHDEDMEMLASENKFMGEFLSKLGYTQEEITEIANTGMSASCDIKILDEEKREEMIKKMVSKDMESIFSSFEYGDTSFLNSVLCGHGFTQYANLTDTQVLAEYNDRLAYWAEDEDSEPECQIKTLDDAKALIGERVGVLENDETSEFNGLVIDASYNAVDGILISVIDQDDQAWDIEPKYLIQVDAEEKNAWEGK